MCVMKKIFFNDHIVSKTPKEIDTSEKSKVLVFSGSDLPDCLSADDLDDFSGNL